MADENSYLAPHPNLIQAAFDSLGHLQDRVHIWLYGQKKLDRINKQRIEDERRLNYAFLAPNPSTRQSRAYWAYQTRQIQFTKKFLERGLEQESLFSSATETLNSLGPAWGEVEVKRLLAELAAIREVAQLGPFIEGVLQRLFDQRLAAASPHSPEEERKGKREHLLTSAEARWQKHVPFIWIRTAAKVNSGDAYRWKNGKLPDDSEMAKRIEEVLRMPKPPSKPQKNH